MESLTRLTYKQNKFLIPLNYQMPELHGFVKLHNNNHQEHTQSYRNKP